jgi:hypothetical protein
VAGGSRWAASFLSEEMLWLGFGPAPEKLAHLAGERNFCFKGASTLKGGAVGEIANDRRQLLADVCALYVKTKNFHPHMSGRDFLRS